VFGDAAAMGCARRNRRLQARQLFSLSPVRRLNLKVEGDRVADLHWRGFKETKFNVTGTEVGGHVVKMRLYPQVTETSIWTEGRRFENHDKLRSLSLKLLHSPRQIPNRPRPITDTGALGPDQQKRGKYLILGHNDPDIKPEGYFVFRSPTNNVWSGQRGLSADLQEAQAVIGKMRVYPYSERNNPKPTAHIRPEGRKWSGEQLTHVDE